MYPIKTVTALLSTIVLLASLGCASTRTQRRQSRADTLD